MIEFHQYTQFKIYSLGQLRQAYEKHKANWIGSLDKAKLRFKRQKYISHTPFGVLLTEHRKGYKTIKL